MLEANCATPEFNPRLNTRYNKTTKVTGALQLIMNRYG